jgi:hypothetical protein
MAYLDGELPADRAAMTAEHLRECAECKAVVDGFRNVSQTLKTWSVGKAEVELPQDVATALNERQEANRDASQRGWRGIWRRQPLLAYAGLMTAVLIAAIGTVRFIGGNANNVFSQVGSQMTDESPSAAPHSIDAVRGITHADRSQSASAPGMVAGRVQDKDRAPAESKMSSASGPMIIRTAELQLITKEFDKARAEVEAILRKHHGYVGDLKVSGATGSGRTLTSTLRVPADQLDVTLAELKTLGRVESESQGGQDVTSQYVDLQARLANARNTEKRLTDLLSQRTGKLSDVLEVEQEVDRVRGEIEQMEAESKHLTKQVTFATLNVTIAEDYKAQLEVVPPSTATRLSNAAVEGYRSMVDGIVSVILFLLSSGPSWLFWGAVLFVPGRLVWKTVRRRIA